MMKTKTIADSIAIKILSRNAILTGLGNELHLQTGQDEVLLPMRLRGKVHGIELGKAINADKLIVYGEKEFMILDWRGKNQFEVFYRGKLTDWISAAKFLHDTREFVLLTAHSILLRFEYSEKSENSTQNCKIVERCSCTDKSTLYCSHLYGNVWEELVVFGGNAFGELLIWQPTQLVINGHTKANLLQRLQMHNGVIFSINYNEQHKLLTTTSDDRSIRFWQVDKTNSNWAETKLTLAASGYGHVARVFQGKLISHANELFAISVGEDSYFCIWRSTGELVYKRRHQFGATIWNFEYEEATKTLFTVGSTGNLLAFGLNDVLENRGNKVSQMQMPQVDANNSTEYVAKIKFLAKDLLIGVTNQNRFIYKHLAEENATWQSVKDFTAYKCTVLEVYNNLVALGGYKRLTLFKYEANSSTFVKLFDGEILTGVIRSFQFFNGYSYLVSDELGNCLMIQGEDLLKRYNIELPKCKERWLTTALLIEDAFLIVSNRLGNLMLYKFIESQEKYELKDTLKHPHGNLGATVLQLVESLKHSAFVRSAGHDGALRLLCIDKQSDTLRPHSREVVPVAWVEHSIPMKESQLLLGFNDNHFVVWSRMFDFSLQVPCGGGHRCWHFVIFEDDSHTKWLQLAFIQHKRVSMHWLKLFNEVQTKIQLPVRNMWHVRPCNALALVENKSNENILISAGDDNLIKISMHHKKSGSLTQKAELHTHISNIRALKVFKLSIDHCLIFSGGGRAQLCLTKVNLNTYQVEELLSYTLKSESNENQRGFSFDPETRIMAIDIVALKNSNEFAIYLGCSDGFVRKLFLNSKMEISLAKEMFYGKCVLQVRCVSDLYVVIAATDGILQFYDLELNEKFLELPHHSSGINALDVLIEEESDLKIIHVLSGGDDQAVSYTKLILDSPLRIAKSLSLKNHHTAQVTAVCLSGRYAFTSGIDQNILKYNLETEAVEEVLHSCVADVKGLCLDSNHGCFLYGCGLQIHNFIS